MTKRSYFTVQSLHKSIQIKRSIPRSKLVFVSGKARIKQKKLEKYAAKNA